ncbi:MAG: hypothetical protein Hens2KO_30540 [Henriciella sp.]
MHWSFFAIAALGLLLAHGLRLPFAGSRTVSAAAFLAGLAVAVIVIKSLAAANGIGRTTDFDRFVNAAVIETADDYSPIIVFTGASYSRNGIDPERLTIALRERGYPHRVVSLSIEAASLLEREQHLKQFIELSGKVPDLVFIEVARDFDHRAAYMFGNSKFNMRAIEQFDLATTAWTGFGVLGGACDGLKGCVLDAAYLGLHSALNTLNVGLIGAGEKAINVSAVPAYDPQIEPREAAEITLSLKTQPAEVFQGPQWIRSYRYQQQQRLLAQGTRAIAYYQPPILDPEARAYIDGLCEGELFAFECFSPNAPDLMAQLNGEHWFDPSHLLDSGTAIYNAWLVEQIVSSGILERGQ